MKFKEANRLYGLNKDDFRIIKLLADEPKSSFYVSKKLKKPRSTILFRLNKLAERGAVKKIGARPNVFWESKIEISSANSSHSQINNNSETITHSGISQVEKIWIKIIEDLKGKLYFLETPHLSKNLNSKLSESFLIRCRRAVIKNKVIQEGVTSMSALTKKSKESHVDKDKMISWSIVPDEKIPFHDSFIVRSDRVFIINLDEDKITEIRNKSLSILVIQNIKSIARHGKKVSFSKAVEDSDLQ